MNTKIATTIIAVVSLICMIITMTPVAQVSNAVDSINTGTIDCNSKKGTADTSAGAFKYGGAKCEGQNGGTVAAGGIKSVTGNTNITSKSTIDCNSKKGTADTSAGAFKYGGAKCEGQNGGTVAAGGIKPITGNTNITSKSTIDCNSKKGTADTSAGAFKYGGAKCEGQNGGTVAAGGIKSGSGDIRLHGNQGPSGNSHFGGIIKR